MMDFLYVQETWRDAERGEDRFAGDARLSWPGWLCGVLLEEYLYNATGGFFTVQRGGGSRLDDLYALDVVSPAVEVRVE